MANGAMDHGCTLRVPMSRDLGRGHAVEHPDCPFATPTLSERYSATPYSPIFLASQTTLDWVAYRLM